MQPATHGQAIDLPQTAMPTPAAAVPGEQAVPVHLQVASHPREASFAVDLAAQLRWMSDGELSRAQLQLHPADLGPVQVQLTMQGQVLEVNFTAANGATRDGLQQALPALRELLASQGLQLGHAGIGGGGANGYEPHRAAPMSAGTNAGRSGMQTDEPPPRQAAPRAGVAKLLDLYA